MPASYRYIMQGFYPCISLKGIKWNRNEAEAETRRDYRRVSSTMAHTCAAVRPSQR